jgi:hypothetical protein
VRGQEEPRRGQAGRGGFGQALRRKRPKGAPLPLRAISAALAEQGHLNERGAPFNPFSIKSMLEGAPHPRGPTSP